jgi:MFS family permease
MSLYLAYNFGILYIVLSTFANLWIDRYGQSVSTSELHYLALAIGYTIAAQVGGPITDRIWRHLQYKASGATAPEYRIPLMIPGALLIPIGLFWYGWAAEARVHWIVPDIGASIFECGIILGMQAMQAYVMDSYSQYTASAMAAAQLLRSMAGFAFPTFAPVLYDKLGYGWGNSILAFAFIAIGVPAPLFLWKFGARIRAKGRRQL